MTSNGFASLHGGLLVRKGLAEPSASAPLSMPMKSRSDTPEDPRYSADRRDSPAIPQSPLNLGSCVETTDAPTVSDLEEALSQTDLRAIRFAAALLDTSSDALITEAVQNHIDSLLDGPLSSCQCFRKRAGRKRAG